MNRPYSEIPTDELRGTYQELLGEYEDYKAKDLKLDMSRGKPCKAQLDLSMKMMDVLNSTSDLTSEDGTDCRNYGCLTGIPEAKKLMADMMEVSPDNVFVYGNASLNIMYDTVARSMIKGVMGSTPWCMLDKVKFLCPVPGYDRHFGITEFFGIEMINVPMSETGPDMDMVERLVSEDESIKGIWCVPQYSNPTGVTYSDDTVRRFARLKPAAADFRIYWDNAYCIHHLYDDRQDHVMEILSECENAGNPDLVYKFASTSKVTFPGSGVSAIAASKNNLKDIEGQLKFQTIGHDKINQLRHVRFFGDINGMTAHMRLHADILRPKFEAVQDILTEELEGLGVAEWTKPNGGYFVSFNVMNGCAKRVVSMCKEAGLVMTPAGAAFPYGNDPDDSNIRIAPTFPPLDDLKTAMHLFSLCVKIVCIEKIIEDRG